MSQSYLLKAFIHESNQLLSVDTVSTEDVQHAVSDAHAAFESGACARIRISKVLTHLARTLEEHVPALAELKTLQTGRAIREREMRA